MNKHTSCTQNDITKEAFVHYMLFIQYTQKNPLTLNLNYVRHNVWVPLENLWIFFRMSLCRSTKFQTVFASVKSKNCAQNRCNQLICSNCFSLNCIELFSLGVYIWFGMHQVMNSNQHGWKRIRCVFVIFLFLWFFCLSTQFILI